MEAEGVPLLAEPLGQRQHFGLAIEDLEVHALGNLEVEGDPRVLRALEGDSEIEMVGSDPEGEDIHAQGAQQFPLLADHVYPEELLPELVLVEEEIERMANFPLHGRGVT